MSLGERIKLKRKEKKLTQKELARILGIDHTTISKWESDTYEPDTKNLNKLAEIFTVSTDYLLNTPFFTVDYSKGYMDGDAMEDIFDEVEGSTVNICFKRPRYIKKTDANGAEISYSITPEQWRKKFFDIHHLLNQDEQIYFGDDRVLTNDEREKLKEIIEIVLRKDK